MQPVYNRTNSCPRYADTLLLRLDMQATLHCLVRYGAIPEVARCRFENDGVLSRGQPVVVATHRGPQLGAVVELLKPAAAPASDGPADGAFTILRSASPDDQARHRDLRRAADADYSVWSQRIRDWSIDVQLIDLEWTLDRAKLVLYVLNDRGPECTKLAIQAAAAGLGIVEVQPVSHDGPVAQPSPGGCGTCGCHN